MITVPRFTLAALAVGVVAILVFAVFHHGQKTAPATPGSKSSSAAATKEKSDPITLWAHNIRLRKGPHFRVYIRWIRGQMLPTNPDVIPSLDNLDSFNFEIQRGVIHANIGDLADYLNFVSKPNGPLTQITVRPEGEEVEIHGILKKIVPLPVAIKGALSPLPNGFIRFHPSKISVLKVPMKGLMGVFHLDVSDIVSRTHMPGIQIVDNDIIFDTSRLLPPPHIRGQITSIRVDAPDIEIIYGNAHNDEVKLSQWHNFLRLSGGTVNFGKLTVHQADLTLIDVDDTPWFGLDLANYQTQLTKGYARITPNTGIEAYMPDLDERSTNLVAPPVTVDILRNRNNSLPGKVEK